MEELFWENTSLFDIDGEKWVDAFGYTGLYEVSNKGRIRSIDRVAIRTDGRKRTIKGRVLRQCKNAHRNAVKDNTFSLYVRIANGDSTYSNKTMASLVLNSFKMPDKYNNITHHINGVSHDNRLENLTFEDLSTKRKIEFDLGIRSGEDNTRHWKENGYNVENLKSDIHLRRPKTSYIREGRNKKPVTVYIEKSGFIGSYTCIKNASEQLNIKQYTLRNALYNPDKFKKVQVKEGVYGIGDFNPKKTKPIKVVSFGGMSYTLAEFSSKYKVPESTLYYKKRTLGVKEFDDWISEKIIISE